MAIDKRILYYGKPEGLPSAVALKAGPFFLNYEQGFLRNIRLGDQEVLRMINHAVRDKNWGTVPLHISDEHVEKDDTSFRISYICQAIQEDVDFKWECLIEGFPDGSISFDLKGKANSDFKKNRTGFTVLHPISECAGKKVTIHQSNGEIAEHAFPKLISPNQPFKDIKAMEWSLGDDQVRLDFEGDIFETEDQRNWIDDSYKTYCTPLDLPFPVHLPKGHEIHQRIRLSIKNYSSSSRNKETHNPLSLKLIDKALKLPKMAIAKSSEVSRLSKPEIAKLKAVAFDHYLVDIKLYQNDWKNIWDNGVYESEQLGLPLSLNLFFDDIKQEMSDLRIALRENNVNISSIQVFNKPNHTTQEGTINTVIPQLHKWFTDVSIGAGTNAFFAELNRNRPSTAQLDHLVYSVNPQVHAFDNDSLVETLSSLPYTIATARSFADGKGICVSPLTFKMRWNPNATGETELLEGQLPEEIDLRQMSLFGAAWTVGAIASLAQSQCDMATFYQTIGSQGIIHSSQPQYSHAFKAPASAIFPMYFVFRYLLKNKAYNFYQLQSSDTLRFGGICFGRSSDQLAGLVICNYSGKEITINLELKNDKIFFLSLDEDNVEHTFYDVNFLENESFYPIGNQGGNFVISIKPYATIYGRIE